MSRTNRNAVRPITVAVAILLAATPANAAQITTNWNGGLGNWNDTTKWSGGVVPNNGVDTFNVFVDNGAVGDSTATVNVGVTIDNLAISAGDTVAIPDNRSLTVVDNAALAGTITNAGFITLNSGGNLTQLAIGNGTVTLTGGGTVTMGNHPANRILGGAGTDLFINDDNLIQGSGQIGANVNNITNQDDGIILANQSNALTIDPNTVFSNAGILRAASGGTLNLNAGTYFNASGLIDAQDASLIQLNGARIEGGLLTSSGSGFIRAFGGAVLDGAPDNVTNTGSISVPDNHTIGLAGTIINNGAFSLISGGNLCQLSMTDGDVTLTGGGTVTLGNNPANRITGGGGTDRLINVNNIIQGAGNIGANVIPITNEDSGLIVANQSNVLNVDPNASMTNNGSLWAQGGTLTLNPAVYANVNGEIRAKAASAVNLNGATIEGGLLVTEGNGIIQTFAGASLDGAPNPISNTGSLTVLDNHTTNVSGSIVNSGTMSLTSVGNLSQLSLSGGDVTFSGAGSINMGNNPANRITGGGGTDRLVNSLGHTVQGAGNIGTNIIGVLNQGSIIANLSNVLTIDPGATFTNTGTMFATGGSTMSLAGGTYVNTGGTIRAENASVVNLGAGAIIDRGTLTTTGTGVIRGFGATLNGSTGPVNNTGTFNVPDNNTVNVQGTLANSGAIDFSSVGNAAGFVLSGNVTINGGGSLTLGNHPANRITGGSATDTLINVNHTIQGSGNVGFNVISINNQSLISASFSNGMTIDPFSNMTNTGTLRANGAVLTLNPATYTNTGGTIQALDGSRVDLNGANIVGGTLTSSGSGFIRGFAGATLDGSVNPVTLSGAFNIPDNHLVTMRGSLIHSGQMSLTTGGNATRIGVGAGGLTLSGGGTITLNNHPANRIEGASPSETLVNQNNTIQGSGNIGFNNLNVNNQALIVANVSNPLTLDPLTTFTNTGTLRATAGAVLSLQPGTYANVGGIIEAQDTSLVDVGAATIAGGTLQTSGNGFFRSLGATLNGSSNTVANAGHFNIPDNNAANITGTINNTGTISLTTAGNVTTLSVFGNATLTGAGTVAMSNHPANRISGSAATDRLFNASNIAGSGNVGLNAIGITNQAAGTITATQSNTLTIDPVDSASFENQGNLHANGGNLSIAAGPFTQTGAVRTFPGFSLSRTGAYAQTGGSTIVNGGLSASSGVQIHAGTLGGAGTVSSPVTTATGGAINPGDPAAIPTGTLSINSTYTQSATGVFTVELAGNATGLSDRLAVSGAATLDGTLNIQLINGYSPAPGDKFTIMNYASHTGEFATINGQTISPTLSWFIKYADNNIRIAARAGCGGMFSCDTDCNGTVNAFDINSFVTLLAAGGAGACSPCAADANGNGTVNTFDINDFIACVAP